MRNIRLSIKLILLLGLSLPFFSCEKECLDVNELDKYARITKEWIPNNDISNQTIIDSYGISQTLIISSIDSISYDNTTEDDCGNIYGNFFYSIQYNTSMSPLHFMIDIHGGSSLDDDFYLSLLITNTNNSANEHKSTTYNFYTKKSVENNTSIKYIEKYNINESYYDVLEIIFNDVFSDNDVKKVYFAKKYGILKFAKNNGNTFIIK